MAANRLPPPDPEDFFQDAIKHWIFDERGEPKAVGIFEYIAWASDPNNSNALKQEKVGDVEVSTVLLMCAANLFEHPPIIFETMIFGGEHDQYQYRYATKSEALLGHARAVQLVLQAQEQKSQGETVSEWLGRHYPSFN